MGEGKYEKRIFCQDSVSDCPAGNPAVPAAVFFQRGGPGDDWAAWQLQYCGNRPGGKVCVPLLCGACSYCLCSGHYDCPVYGKSGRRFHRQKLLCEYGNVCWAGVSFCFFVHPVSGQDYGGLYKRCDGPETGGRLHKDFGPVFSANGGKLYCDGNAPLYGTCRTALICRGGSFGIQYGF